MSSTSNLRKSVFAKDGPTPKSVLSPAIVHNGLVYCSGHLGINPKTDTLVEGDIGDRTTQALKNMILTLEAAGSSRDNILKINIYVTSMDDVPTLNDAYERFFPTPRPARACVAVAGLGRGTDVEIECTAFVNTSSKL